MKKYHVILFVVLILVISVWILETRIWKNRNNVVENQLALCTLRNEDYVFGLESGLINNDLMLDESLMLFKDNGDSLNLSSVVNEPKLVFRYTNLDCHQCIDKQFNLLRNYLDTIGSRRIVIFTYYTNPRDLMIFRRLNNIHFNIYNVENLNIPMEKFQFPYFFVS